MKRDRVCLCVMTDAIPDMLQCGDRASLQLTFVVGGVLETLLRFLHKIQVNIRSPFSATGPFACSG